MASMEQHPKTQEGWIRVFSPDTRCVAREEIPPDEIRNADAAGDEGVWLEVRCPENKCLTGEGRLTIPVKGTPPRNEEGLWHKLFCPEDRCFGEFPSDIPS